jgi:hypothetical protein
VGAVGALNILGGPQPPTILFCLRVLLHLQRFGCCLDLQRVFLHLQRFVCRFDLQRADRNFRGIIYILYIL